MQRYSGGVTYVVSETEWFQGQRGSSKAGEGTSVRPSDSWWLQGQRGLSEGTKCGALPEKDVVRGSKKKDSSDAVLVDVFVTPRRGRPAVAISRVYGQPYCARHVIDTQLNPRSTTLKRHSMTWRAISARQAASYDVTAISDR